MCDQEQNTSNNDQTSDEIQQNPQNVNSKVETNTIDPVLNKHQERIVQLETELTKLQESIRDTQLRAQAEMENIRRRAEMDVEKAHKFALEKFVSELLPVIDNLERALKIIDKENLESSSIIKGIELTHKSFLDTIQKFGVEMVGEAKELFNPEIHQAMSMIESEEVQPNHVLIVMQRGYMLNRRLLRPAMVAVAKAKS